MLILPLRPCVRYDLASALAKWLDSDDIQVSFNSSNSNPLQFVMPKPEFRSMACQEDLMRLQSLRNCLSDCFCKSVSHKHSLEEGALEDCYEYHAALLEFEKRGFPTLDDDPSSCNATDGSIKLSWKSAYEPHKPEVHNSLVWERISITYNIVALLSEKMIACSPADRDECKQAVSYGQTGASLLGVLKELIASAGLEHIGHVELSSAHLTFWEKFLLAYAQTSIYRMAALNTTTTSNHATLAILAQGSYSLYNEALEATKDPRLQSELPQESQEWGTFCKAVSMLQAAKASYHQAVVHRLAMEWAKEIAWLQNALEKLHSCQQFCASLEKQQKSDESDSIASYTKRECLAILPVVKDRLDEADKDNYKVYQDYPIPKTVPELQGRCMAKSSPNLPAYMLTPKKPLFVGL